MKGRAFIGWVFLVAVLGMAIPARADTHAPWPADWNNWSDPNLMVTVGNPGNAADRRYDANGFGAVAYEYRIGKYEVTAGQYTEFLNKVAKTDTYGLYNTNMDWDTFPGLWGCNIKRTGLWGSYTYSVDPNRANRAVNYVSWGDAARFANWLTNGHPTGAQDANTTEDGSYYLNGALTNAELLAVTVPDASQRAIWSSGTKQYFLLPSEDEWYKAAYYEPNKPGGAGYWDYPTGSDNVPGQDMSEVTNPGNNVNYYNNGYLIGSPYYRTEVGEFELSESPYGTFDQGGNLWEWNEAIVDTGYRGSHGGSYGSDYPLLLAAATRGKGFPADEVENVGFRVAEVPEPGTLSLLALGGLAALRRGSGREPRRRK
jgi:formylglycine-generating enzyme required for sulfatase activity